MTLAVVYYMTNYTTKYDVSQYQLILTAAIVKRAIKDAKACPKLSERQLQIKLQDINKFALRVFNYLSADCEISNF